jgi:hypothetical protein
MSVQISIDTVSRSEAETLAASLPGAPQTASARGYGLIRFRCRDKRELQDLIASIHEAVQKLGLSWVRVRHGDEEHVFRGRHRQAS